MFGSDCGRYSRRPLAPYALVIPSPNATIVGEPTDTGGPTAIGKPTATGEPTAATGKPTGINISSEAIRPRLQGDGANATAFAVALPDGKLSMAKLQGFLLKHKGDLSGASAVCAVPDLLPQSKPVPLVTLTAWAHLRRLGLERHVLLFESHGYSTKAAMDAARLKAGECAHWRLSRPKLH